jgi:hypothetical protein
MLCSLQLCSLGARSDGASGRVPKAAENAQLRGNVTPASEDIPEHWQRPGLFHRGVATSWTPADEATGEAPGAGPEPQGSQEDRGATVKP